MRGNELSLWTGKLSQQDNSSFIRRLPSNRLLRLLWVLTKVVDNSTFFFGRKTSFSKPSQTHHSPSIDHLGVYVYVQTEVGAFSVMAYGLWTAVKLTGRGQNVRSKVSSPCWWVFYDWRGDRKPQSYLKRLLKLFVYGDVQKAISTGLTKSYSLWSSKSIYMAI